MKVATVRSVIQAIDRKAMNSFGLIIVKYKVIIEKSGAATNILTNEGQRWVFFFSIFIAIKIQSDSWSH